MSFILALKIRWCGPRWKNF